MAILSNLDAGKKYSFSLKTGNIIKGDYTNVELITTGTAYGYLQYNPRQLHEQLAGSIPSIAELNYDQYIYYLFRGSDGIPFIIGDPWIESSTVIQEENAYLEVKIYGAGSSQVEAIRTLLASRNFSNVEITPKGGNL